MNNKNVRVIYQKIEPNFLKKHGYINLNHREINTKDDLLELTAIFRNPIYETFRIIYMNNNKVVGYESITTRTPNSVKLFRESKNGKDNSARCFYKIKNRMERLNANGYYMVHNHPGGNAKSSSTDLKATEEFYEKIKGFKGHLIINLESYAWIDIDKRGRAVSNDYIAIKKHKKDKLYKMMNRKSIYDVKITSRDDLVYLMYHIKNSKDYSTAILTDCSGKVRMILDIPNRFMNMPRVQLSGYFNNLCKLNGTTRVFFATEDIETYKKSLKYFEADIFTDSICYKQEGKKIYVYEKVKDKESEKTESENLTVKEEETEYRKDLEVQDVPKGKIRILYKKVGKTPKMMLIDNTLEAKQKLVGGLIEVVQYGDVLLICNEEGKILNLPPNVIFDYDYIAGDCFVIGDDYERGDFKSLTFEEIERYTQELSKRSFIYKKINTEKEKSLKKKQEERCC